ncbi:phospholipase A2 A2-actitoxin-Ucs2a-like [Actinia tenebrosa]|uniref:Phospholipase A2 n=1 Tax=Actinia tenebrosa TaxID=6105 RepID=A0A6P8HMC4_ACTTE|nr:phospholipase A2 A2-actitoxin-Ucs2a-like [Actinia tenebrosa]
MMKNHTIMLVVLLGMDFLVNGLSLNNLEDEKIMDFDADNVPAEKRNLLQFGKMIRCATGRSPWKYNNYGNYCGSGGSGVPVDGVDRCCQAHDRCYDNNDHCNPKWKSYNYATAGTSPSCRITCGGSSSNDQCQTDVCECDKVAAECFARNTYNSNNKHK